ncbi:MAG: DUF3592 domain-containing protein [Oscillospiraceae bacterium]|nr:DUF3592 domain-containing protein [Oscillospiraceae bacterium]
MAVVFYLILFGAVALSIGYKGLKTYLFNRKLDYVIVQGKVVELEKSTQKRGKKTSITYTPIFEYYYNGQTRRARHIISSSRFNKKLEVVPSSKYEVGDEVELRVYVNAPDYAVVNTNSSVKFSLYMGAVATLAGLLMLAEGIYLLLTKIM